MSADTLDCVHMYANNVRFANAVFSILWISIGMFTCIRLPFGSSDGRFAAEIVFCLGSQKITFGRKLASIEKSGRCGLKSRKISLDTNWPSDD